MKVIFQEAVTLEYWPTDLTGPIRDVLNYFSPRLKFKSADVAREEVLELCTMFVEGFTYEKEEQKRPEVVRAISLLIRRINKFREILSKWNPTVEQLTTAVYNFILALEGHALLPGFGIGNRYGDRSQGNPEKKSIYLN
jgi:hypothetical protein